jgi:hypothetical protein
MPKKKTTPTTTKKRVITKWIIFFIIVLCLIDYLQLYEAAGTRVVVGESPLEAATSSASNSYSVCNEATSNIMALQEVQHVVAEYHANKMLAQEKMLRFADVGQVLYQHALDTNQTLLTVQVGGMDGITRDPMYNMMIPKKIPSLKNWLPVVVEPAPYNFKALTENYQGWARDRDWPALSWPNGPFPMRI